MTQTLLRNLIRTNKRISKSLARLWPHTSFEIFDACDRDVARYAGRGPRVQLVADVGAGNRCSFRKYVSADNRMRIIGVDTSQKAMKREHRPGEKQHANVVEDLPFADDEVDLLVSRAVLEHLPDVEKFVANSARVVGPGGYSIHVPNAWSRRLMAHLCPRNVSGFSAFCDRSYYAGCPGGVREAWARDERMASCTCGAVTSFPSTTTCAGTCAPRRPGCGRTSLRSRGSS
jgi:ubiquinone/menaquinone biosynthesis C-methylase UbiE